MAIDGPIGLTNKIKNSLISIPMTVIKVLSHYETYLQKSRILNILNYVLTFVHLNPWVMSLDLIIHFMLKISVNH